MAETAEVELHVEEPPKEGIDDFQKAEQFSDAVKDLEIPLAFPVDIRFSILLHIASQRPNVENGRRLGRIFDALIGEWDWSETVEPKEGPGHTPDNPVWIVALSSEQKEEEPYVAHLDKTTAQDLWDELGRKCDEEEPKKDTGPACQHCGRMGEQDTRWNTIQIMAATKLLDALGYMLGDPPDKTSKKKRRKRG